MSALDLFAAPVVEPALPGYPCVFSPDRRYRYALWRVWGDAQNPRYLLVIGLNPSTADETQDDPTIRRCIGFAKEWGFDALCMTNLFGFRATKPENMKAELDPVGPLNMDWLLGLAGGANLVLAAWGADGHHLEQDQTTRERLAARGIPLHALGTTKSGQPRHPLYMPKSARPLPYPVGAP